MDEISTTTAEEQDGSVANLIVLGAAIGVSAVVVSRGISFLTNQFFRSANRIVKNMQEKTTVE